ncbi:hypothetical protein MMPV_000540 [Pyropia vietnamensis]
MHRIKRATFRPLSRKHVNDDEHQALRTQVTDLRRDMERALELLSGSHRAWRSVFRNAASFANHTSDVHGAMAEYGTGVKGLESPLTAAAEATSDADAAMGAAMSRTRGGGFDDYGRGSGSDDGQHVTPPGGTAVALTRRVRVWVQDVRGMKVDMDAAAVAEKEAALYARKVASLEAKNPSRRGGRGLESKHEERLSRNVEKLEDAEAARNTAVEKANARMQDAVDDGGGVLEAVVLAYWSLYGDMVVLAGQAGEAGARMVDDRAERVLSRSSSRSRKGLFMKTLSRSPSEEERGRRPSRERRRSTSRGRRSASGERRSGAQRRRSRDSSHEFRQSGSRGERHRSRSGDGHYRSGSGDGLHRSRSGDGRHRSRSGERHRSGERRQTSGGFLRRLRGKD